MSKEALKLALEAFDDRTSLMKWQIARDAVKEALAQPERDYERGFIDGMQKQMQSSVDKAVNRMAQPEQTNTRPYYTIDELNAWADEKEKQAWRNAAIRVGEELSSVGPDGYYDMNAWQWLDWAMENVKKAQPEQEPVAWKPIETAPKDAMVLVCLPRQMNLVVRAWYNSIHNFWQTDYEGEGGITRPIYFHEGDLWHPIPPLYTTPPQRKPLTDERIADIVIEMNGNEPTALFWRDLAQAIEAAHGIKE